MNKKLLYKINISLILVGILVLLSSIQLEMAEGYSFFDIEFNYWVILHLIITIIISVLIYYHLAIRWGGVTNWIRNFKKIKSKQVKWLSWLFLVTFITGIISTLIFFKDGSHSGVGGFHGKFGFITLILMSFHLNKRFRWYKIAKRNIINYKL